MGTEIKNLQVNIFINLGSIKIHFKIGKDYPAPIVNHEE